MSDHLHRLQTVHDDRFAREYGPWRPVVAQVADKFLTCGVLDHGFARIRCDACTHEYLLASSCKCRYFCPSRHAKRLASWARWLETTLLAPVALERLMYDATAKAVTYRSDKSEGPTAGTEIVDPREFVARVVVHIPDKDHGTTRYHGCLSRAPPLRAIQHTHLRHRLPSMRQGGGAGDPGTNAMAALSAASLTNRGCADTA